MDPDAGNEHSVDQAGGGASWTPAGCDARAVPHLRQPQRWNAFLLLDKWLTKGAHGWIVISAPAMTVPAWFMLRVRFTGLDQHMTPRTSCGLHVLVYEVRVDLAAVALPDSSTDVPAG